ncbi:MAG TPA: hypothetical protein VHF86_05060, partial [Xanthomonadaceae bacterium]|nr:hypothetical protein [Xanthomonadaceae bacterium]
RGVVLRPMGGYGLGECLRITVGTEAENRRLLEALDGVLLDSADRASLASPASPASTDARSASTDAGA